VMCMNSKGQKKTAGASRRFGEFGALSSAYALASPPPVRCENQK
jgi:hypothetical protein